MAVPNSIRVEPASRAPILLTKGVAATPTAARIWTASRVPQHPPAPTGTPPESVRVASLTCSSKLPWSHPRLLAPHPSTGTRTIAHRTAFRCVNVPRATPNLCRSQPATLAPPAGSTWQRPAAASGARTWGGHFGEAVPPPAATPPTPLGGLLGPPPPAAAPFRGPPPAAAAMLVSPLPAGALPAALGGPPSEAPWAGSAVAAGSPPGPPPPAAAALSLDAARGAFDPSPPHAEWDPPAPAHSLPVPLWIPPPPAPPSPPPDTSSPPHGSPAPLHVDRPLRPSLVHDIALHAHALFTTPREAPQRADLSRRLAHLIHRVEPRHLRPLEMVANVEYYGVFESDLFTICVFALRAGASMPIHDHPEMNVFRWVSSPVAILLPADRDTPPASSKVVYGTLHVTSYRLLSHPPPQPLTASTFAQPAQITLDADIPHTHPASLQEIDSSSPHSATLHSFRAVSDGVLVLDIIGPPYAGERPCRYYREASEDEVVNLALPSIAGASRQGPRRSGGSSDEDAQWTLSSRSLKIPARKKSDKARKKRRDRGNAPADGLLALLAAQARGDQAPWDISGADASASSLASLEGQFDAWALAASPPNFAAGDDFDASTRSLPDAARAQWSGTLHADADRFPHGRSGLGGRGRAFASGRLDFGPRANARALARGASVGSGGGPTAWAIGQGDVGRCLWLLEDPTVEYDCIAREYGGEMVYLGTEEAGSPEGGGEVPVVGVDLGL
ncbi:hypothetical protein DFJ74DRAFT_690721 [Hyaloraphidium curvatum]|nr:hypothetical protein DFJ74DRAFT_690721 [Hyaloraphidium curvatum]